MGTAAHQIGVIESSQSSAKDIAGPCVAEDLEKPSEDVGESSLSGEISSPKESAVEQKLEFTEGVLCRQSNDKSSPGSRACQYTAREIVGGLSRCFHTKNIKIQASPENLVETSSAPEETSSTQALALHFDENRCALEEWEKSESPDFQNEFATKNASLGCDATIKQLKPCFDSGIESKARKHIGVSPDNVAKIPSVEPGLPQTDLDKSSNLGLANTPTKDKVKNSNRIGRKIKTKPNLKKKYMLRSSLGSDRVLRSKSQTVDKTLVSSTNTADNSSKEEVKKKRKKRRKRTLVTDEYSRIRKHLRYLLHRMNYEQSLILAYSGEGWKGQSLEKIKLEKELQRARCEILRRKLKIRDLFQQIDSLCAEGKLPSSLFDSEGQITSEDIFCAKCGSKDLTTDNDIILCDGTCDRGFHQFCLVPPLLKEDIPPDDEGWLCPGCDCKVDCADLLNDSQGTDLSITDSWEKVFPEAAAAASGQNLDNNIEFPSDDSEDDNYDPESSRSGEKSQDDELSSDESDCSSASDDLVGLADDKQYLGLPSEDSGDNDYDPDAPDHDEEMKQESSSSDFTSDSEDLAALSNNELPGEDQTTASTLTRKESGGRRSKLCKKENLSMLSSNPCQDASIYGKRNIERSDYKKLYDESYGNIASSSADDENYTDTVGPSRSMGRRTEDFVSSSVNEITSLPKDGGKVELEDMKHDVNDVQHNSRRACQKSSSKVENITSINAHETSSPSNLSGKRIRSSPYKKLGDAVTRIRSSPYKKLGDAVTRRLHRSFKENQYPDRTTKESLAKELGLALKQVSKWFENARWSFNHSPSMAAKICAENQENGSLVPKANERTPRTDPEKATCNGAHAEDVAKGDGAATVSCGDNVIENEMEGLRKGKRKSATSVSKTKDEIDHVTSRTRKVETPQRSTKAQGTQVGGKKTKRMKSIA